MAIRNIRRIVRTASGNVRSRARILRNLTLALSALIIGVTPIAITSTSVSAATFEVTSLSDDGSPGTLRWAMTQANSNAGTDTITFSSAVAGTITLTSDLPAVAETVTIDGPGQSVLTISGANNYRPFTVAFGNDSSVVFTVRDLTLTNGGGDGGREGESQFIYNSRATVRATRVTFKNTNGMAVSNWGGTTVSTYTDCIFRNNNVGIFGDHGTTPTAVTNDDTEYTNRTYVIDSLFEDNQQAISQERWTKISGSTFRNNGYAANIRGLNRTQITNSTFTGNSVAVYHTNWTPTEWTSVGRNNRLHDGNTFTNNNYAFILMDSWNDGQSSQQWATLSNNEWDGDGVWVYASDWNGQNNVDRSVDEVQATGISWREINNTDRSVIPTPTTTTPPTPVDNNNQQTSTDASSNSETGGSNIASSPLLTQTNKTTGTTIARSSSSSAVSTTTTPVATTTTTIPAPTAPEVSSGEAGATVDGEEVDTTLTRNNNALVVSAAGIEASIYGMTDDGQRVNLDEDGFLRLETSDQIVVEAEGFVAGDEVDVWMYSTPAQLGRVAVDANGVMKGTFSLPPGVDSGDHRVVLNGQNNKGQDVILGIGVAVGEVSQSSLISRLLIIVPVSLAIVFALIIPTALKRRRDESLA